MVKFGKDFFLDNEVLFVGYSKGKNSAFSKTVYQTLVNKGIKVYPLNNKSGGSSDVKVYQNIAELPKIPKSAYVLLNSSNSANVVKQLADSGVKRILFQSKRNVTPETLEACSKLGIETAVACPMMVFGSGMHKLHAFFAGVRK